MITLSELIAELIALRDEFQAGSEQVYFRGTPYYIQVPIEKAILNQDGEIDLLDSYGRERNEV